jgi:hypothetical protein
MIWNHDQHEQAAGNRQSTMIKNQQFNQQSSINYQQSQREHQPSQA